MMGTARLFPGNSCYGGFREHHRPLLKLRQDLPCVISLGERGVELERTFDVFARPGSSESFHASHAKVVVESRVLKGFSDASSRRSIAKSYFP